MKRIVFLVLCVLTSWGAVTIPVAARSNYIYPSLYRAYGDYFDISVAVEPEDLTTHTELAERQFNVIVTENQLKPWIHKGEDTWYWSGGDKIVDFALKNDKRVRAHTLVCPDFFDYYSKSDLQWFYQDEDGDSLFDSSGNPVEGAKELALARLESHIKTIVQRYKGKIYAYDVVNEAYKEFGATRDYTKFCRLLGGDEWILKCFQWAHEADPDAVLIYNDNGFTADIKKQEVIYNKVKEIRDAGIPVSIGMQMHYSSEVRLDLVENLLKKFSDLCDIYITELDMGMFVRVLGDSISTDSNGNKSKIFETKIYPDYMYDEVAEIQARKYGSLFDLFREYKDSIKCVGFWSLADNTSYQGAERMPMVFDEAGEPKASFYRILDFEKALPRWEETDRLPKYRAIDYTINKETDTITVKGTTDGEKIVKATLFNPSFEDGVSEAEYINNEKTITADGDFEIQIPIIYTQSFEDPTYKLQLTIGEEVLYEDITYYSENHKDAGYKIYDDLNDFSKMHSFYNVGLTSCITFYDDDSSGITFSSGQQADRFIMYRVPDDRIISKVTVNAYVYETEKYRRPQISTSTDGMTFTAVSNSFLPWNNQWQEIPKISYTDVTMANQRKHYRQSIDVKESSGVKYIKIDINNFSESWHIYIDDVEIETIADENYQMPSKEGIIASVPKLFVHTASKKLQTAFAHSGTLSTNIEIENHTGVEKKLMHAMAQKHEGKLKSINCDTAVLKPQEKRTFSASLNNCTLVNGSQVEMFLFDMTEGQLNPIYQKSVFDVVYQPDTILHDDFDDFSKMYSHTNTLKTFDATSWSFDDVTLIEQSSDWSGGEIVYKAKDDEVFKSVEAVIYTNVADDFRNITQYGTPYISVSDDGKNFTTVLGGKEAKVSLSNAGWIGAGCGGSVPNTQGNWFTKRVANVKIPDGAKYVKLGFPGPLFNAYHIKLGEIELKSYVQVQ